MNQRLFIKKARSIFEDNNGARFLPRQLYGSKIDPIGIALADTGSERLYQKAERRKYADYHFCFLIDASGSMIGKIRCASKALHALYYAVTSAGASAKCFSFNADFLPIDSELLSDDEKLYVELMERVGGSYSGCTHNSFAVRKAISYLMKQQTQARILLVFSDGIPSCGCHNRKGDQDQIGARGLTVRGDLLLAIKEARRLGITVLSLGIETDTTEFFYGKKFDQTVSDVKDVYQSALKILERNIKRG